MQRNNVLLIVLLAGLAFVIAPGKSQAQDINTLAEKLGIKDLASEYLRPAADAIGYSFNSGLFHTAEVKEGLHVWIGLRGVWTFVPDDNLTFTAKLPEEITNFGYPNEVTTATVFGGKGAVLSSTNPEYDDIVLPDGINSQSTYLILPHVTFGSFAGFELMVRGIPPVTYDEKIGKISFIGAGLKWSPTSFTSKDNNFDIAFMGAVQQFKTGEYITVSNYNVNAHASLDMGIITIFSGLGYEGYNIDVSYTYTPDINVSDDLPADLNQPQEITLDFFRRNLRYTVGANLTLIPLVNFTADYSFGVQDNFSFGAGITF